MELYKKFFTSEWFLSNNILQSNYYTKFTLNKSQYFCQNYMFLQNVHVFQSVRTPRALTTFPQCSRSVLSAKLRGISISFTYNHKNWKWLINWNIKSTSLLFYIQIFHSSFSLHSLTDKRLVFKLHIASYHLTTIKINCD